MIARKERGGATSVALTYADVNVHRPATFWDYDAINIQWGGQDQYDVVRWVGRGKYSDVFEALNVLNGKPCIVKILKPVKPRKIRREISILQTLFGGPNVIKLLDLCLEPNSKTPSLVFEHVQNMNYRTLFSSWNLDDVRFYLMEVLRALEYAHSNGVMHRDVKPQNIMYDPNKRILRLIDWGLAEYYHPHKEYNVRVASRYFKGPELLIDLQDYDYSLDIWSLGCVFAGIIFLREPMFKGRHNHDQLVRIAMVLGTDDLFDYAAKYGIALERDLVRRLGSHARRPWANFVQAENRHLATPEAMDLLSKMLRYDHTTRITAREAMDHPFFAPLRDQSDGQPSGS